MKKSEMVVIGAAVGAYAYWKSGRSIPLPWKLYRQLGNAVRRKMENDDYAVMVALHRYADMNPGSISDMVLEDAETQFTETMIDNDFMGVWNSFFKRKHPYVPNHESVLSPSNEEDEDDE